MIDLETSGDTSSRVRNCEVSVADGENPVVQICFCGICQRVEVDSCLRFDEILVQRAVGLNFSYICSSDEIAITAIYHDSFKLDDARVINDECSFCICIILELSIEAAIVGDNYSIFNL